MRELYTETEINAGVSQTWRLLVDVGHYCRWNPLIVAAEGNVAPGEQLRIRIRPPGGTEMPYTVTVLDVVPEQRFSWLGKMGLPGLLDGEHSFELQSLDAGRVKLVHRERFRGLLVPLLWRLFLDRQMRRGFEQLNQRLKALAERPAGCEDARRSD